MSLLSRVVLSKGKHNHIIIIIKVYIGKQDQEAYKSSKWPLNTNQLHGIMISSDPHPTIILRFQDEDSLVTRNIRKHEIIEELIVLHSDVSLVYIQQELAAEVCATSEQQL
jgi:uncharacterized protein (UPF0297 family)